MEGNQLERDYFILMTFFADNYDEKSVKNVISAKVFNL
jgi:hypothetical protein